MTSEPKTNEPAAAACPFAFIGSAYGATAPAPADARELIGRAAAQTGKIGRQVMAAGLSRASVLLARMSARLQS